MKRRVSWATAVESTIDNKPSPFPPGAPLHPPPFPLPARRCSIVSAVLALAESPSPPPWTLSEGDGASRGDVRRGGMYFVYWQNASAVDEFNGEATENLDLS